jgi:hypothetical protein
MLHGKLVGLFAVFEQSRMGYVLGMPVLVVEGVDPRQMLV